LKLPPGLSGVLAGVPPCPEAQANAGTCDPASEIGETTLGLGLGADPYTIVGRVYLTGPYDGTGTCSTVGGGGGTGTQSNGCAPFGLAIVVPPRVGPFTLQEGRPIVVRAKLEIDPATAALTIATGAIPTIIEGIPLQIKDLNITIGRAGFIVNPTNCAAMRIEGTVDGGEGDEASVSAPFQLANCTDLKFDPKLTALTRARTSRAGGASLSVKLTYPKAASGRSEIGRQANLASVKVDLPRQLVSRLATLGGACLASVFDRDPAACPASSRVGTASVSTPVLPVKMAGPAYFVSHGGKRFPELILVLHGDGVTVDLSGETSIDSAGVTSSTFRKIPDVPVETFELDLPEGPGSALAANGKLCHVRGGLKMPTALTAHNGAVIHQNTPIRVTGCPAARPKARPRKAPGV
jgi:hypothetical protein